MTTLMIVDTILAIIIGIASFVFFSRSVMYNKWEFTLKWVSFAAVAIFFIAQLAPGIEFIRLTLLLFMAAGFLGKLASRAILEDRRFWG